MRSYLNLKHGTVLYPFPFEKNRFVCLGDFLKTKRCHADVKAKAAADNEGGGIRTKTTIYLL